MKTLLFKDPSKLSLQTQNGLFSYSNIIALKYIKTLVVEFSII